MPATLEEMSVYGSGDHSQDGDEQEVVLIDEQIVLSTVPKDDENDADVVVVSTMPDDSDADIIIVRTAVETKEPR